jgi:hypothetical protein
MWNITQFLKAGELRWTVWPSPQNSTESPLGLMSERGSFTSEIHLRSPFTLFSQKSLPLPPFQPWPPLPNRHSAAMASNNSRPTTPLPKPSPIPRRRYCPLHHPHPPSAAGTTATGHKSPYPSIRPITDATVETMPISVAPSLQSYAHSVNAYYRLFVDL